jgi:hypothetical protein
VAAAVSGVVVPSEGPVNMGKQGAHEHRGSAGMLSPNLIWLEIGRRVVLDDGVDIGFLPAATAIGVLRVRATEGGEEGPGSLQVNDVVLLTPWIMVERLCTGWSAEGRAAAEEGAHRSCGECAGMQETEIGGLRSTSGPRRSSGCTGLGFGGDVGGCRRWPETAAEAG